MSLCSACPPPWCRQGSMQGARGAAGRAPSPSPGRCSLGCSRCPTGSHIRVPSAGAQQGWEWVGQQPPGGSCPSFLPHTVLAPPPGLPPCSQPQRTSQDRVTQEWRPLLTLGARAGQDCAHEPHPLAVSGDPQGHPSPAVGSPGAPLPVPALPMALYLCSWLLCRLWSLGMGCRAVAPRTVFPGIPNLVPKGFLGKLDPEDTATRALCQSLLLSRLRVWLVGQPPPCPCCAPTPPISVGPFPLGWGC